MMVTVQLSVGTLTGWIYDQPEYRGKDLLIAQMVYPAGFAGAESARVVRSSAYVEHWSRIDCKKRCGVLPPSGATDKKLKCYLKCFDAQAKESRSIYVFVDPLSLVRIRRWVDDGYVHYEMRQL